MFKGKDVKKGLKIIDEIIAPKLIGLSCEDQENIDKVLLDLDKSNQKINIGGNVTTAISYSVIYAQIIYIKNSVQISFVYK